MIKLQSYKKFSFCFFTRIGGVSEKNFSSLNCAYDKGDQEENVSKNRKIISNLFSNRKIILPKQTHSNIVFKIVKSPPKLFEADAIITRRKDILIGVLTADCAPIIVIGEENFSIIHVGWRGLLNGIIENTLNKLILEGENIKNLAVFVGPHLKKSSFEVKEGFIEILKSKVNNYQNFVEEKNRKKKFDFSKLIEFKLLKYKISNYNISNEDTFISPNKFFSHRYCFVNKIKNCGRQISLVGIKNK